MNKKILVAIVSVALSFTSLFAEDAETERKISYSAGVDFTTNYIWRGYDVFSSKLAADGNQSSPFNFAPAIVPSITFDIASTGLSFNVWSSFALLSRDNATAGLGNADEVDLTASYSVEDKSGSFTGSFIGYLYPTAETPANLITSYPELSLSYSAPVILNPTIGMAAAFGAAGGSTEYFTLGISHDFEFDKLTLSPGLTFGYWLVNSDPKSNLSHLDVLIPVSYAITDSFDVHASFTGSYRISGTAYDTTVYSPFIMAVAVGVGASF